MLIHECVAESGCVRFEPFVDVQTKSRKGKTQSESTCVYVCMYVCMDGCIYIRTCITYIHTDIHTCAIANDDV
jgi:hypothetical protein